MRRVVVTGLGAITPLGVGVRPTWRRLLASESGLVSVARRGQNAAEQAQWRELTSTVAGIVPTAPPTPSSSSSSSSSSPGEDALWRASDWLAPADQRRMSLFAQYAVAAAEMALRDAGWQPTGHDARDMTGVCLGSGIGNLDDVYATSVAYERDVGRPFFCSFSVGAPVGRPAVV